MILGRDQGVVPFFYMSRQLASLANNYNVVQRTSGG